MRLLLRCLMATLFVTLHLSVGSAQQVADSFKGKPLRIVIGSAPGQAYDIWARTVARHLGRHVPGSPTVVVQNMPGAGELLATNWLYNIAPRDGTVWGSVSRNIPNVGFQGTPGARFDANKFHWLGSPEITNRGCFSLSSAKVKKAEDLFEHELIVGGIGAGSAVTAAPNLLSGMLGMKFKIVEGYVTPQDAILAMERGELEGVCQTVESFVHARPQWLKNDFARVLFTGERDPVPGLNAPTIFKFAKTEEHRRILSFFASSIELGRPYLLPPETPADIVQLMRKSFDSAINDPLFRDDAKKQGLIVTHQSGEQIQALVLEASKTSPEIIARASEYAQRKR
jgi:tripartite-type tricarboxylate transporter receptor subunit TctC